MKKIVFGLVFFTILTVIIFTPTMAFSQASPPPSNSSTKERGQVTIECIDDKTGDTIYGASVKVWLPSATPSKSVVIIRSGQTTDGSFVTDLMQISYTVTCSANGYKTGAITLSPTFSTGTNGLVDHSPHFISLKKITTESTTSTTANPHASSALVPGGTTGTSGGTTNAGNSSPYKYGWHGPPASSIPITPGTAATSGGGSSSGTSVKHFFTLIPSEGPAGTPVSVLVYGFPSGWKITLPPGATSDSTTTASGTTEFKVVIPKDAQDGPYVIPVKVGDVNLKAVFTVRNAWHGPQVSSPSSTTGTSSSSTSTTGTSSSSTSTTGGRYSELKGEQAHQTNQNNSPPTLPNTAKYAAPTLPHVTKSSSGCLPGMYFDMATKKCLK